MSKLSFKKRRVSILSVIVMVFIFSMTSFACAQDGDFDESSDFTTEKYDVRMNVGRDASAYITEDITVDINSPMHGIFRYIPLSRRVDYEARGTRIKQSYAAMKISDVSVQSEPYKMFRKNGNIVIRIGDENELIKDRKKYSLSYKVSLYEDDNDKYDSFYYNVLPFDWETSIKKTKITLVMPGSFEKKNVYITAGESGSDAYTDRIEWKKKGNTITINNNKTLPEGTGITVGIKLPEGYFDGEMTHTLFNVIMYAIGILFILLMIFLWLRFGRDPKSVQTVEFYPPEDTTSADIGYIIDGHVDKKDVVSLLFYFAQHGNLSIEEKGKNDYLISRLQDLPPTAKTYERVFFDGIFQSSDQVMFSELEDSFYETYDATKEMIEAEYESRKKRIFHGRANIFRILMVVVPTIAAGIFGWMIWRTFGSILLMLAAAVVVILIPASYIIGISVQDRVHTMPKGKVFLLSVLNVALSAAAMLLTVWIAVSVLGNWIMALLYAGVIAIGCFTSRFMRSRTKHGAEMLGRILGFREFIRIAEKDRLEKMVEENPQYFYDILPYAYVMGLSKKWARKFEDIAVEKPEWYKGSYSDTVFNTWMFYGMFNDLSRYANATMKAPSVDSGDRSFGGGGFSSGGGFGGGGGGGW